MFSPFTDITSYRVRAHLASRFVMSCIVIHLFALYLLFLPPLLSLDTETDAAATQYDYGVDDHSLLTEQPGKPPPLITRYHLLFSIMLALELCSLLLLSVNPIVMHSLSLLLLLLPLPAILHA